MSFMRAPAYVGLLLSSVLLDIMSRLHNSSLRMGALDCQYEFPILLVKKIDHQSNLTTEVSNIRNRSVAVSSQPSWGSLLERECSLMHPTLPVQ